MTRTTSLATSLLVLPLPLLQGWVLDRLVPLFDPSREAPAIWRTATGLLKPPDVV